MVSLHSLLITVTAIATLPLSLAKVYNVTAPPSAASGTNITAVLFTEGYIQNWDDFGVIWGLQLASHTCDACIGTMLSYNNLYGDPKLPTQIGNETFSVPIPAGYTPGPYTLIAGVPYLVGASGESGINYFKSNITVS